MRSRQRFIGLVWAAGIGVGSVGVGGTAAFGQTPGTQTNNPYPGVRVGATVGVRDFATLPNSNGAPARLNSAAVAPDGRFFVVDQRGPVYDLSSGGAATPYLNVASLNLALLNDNGERGVSQIAFHPQFDQTGAPGFGKAYVSFSTSNTSVTPDFASPVSTRTHDEVIYELTTTTPRAATFQASAAPRQVLRIAQPASNHNGGGLAFNPTAAVGSADYGALYDSSGDGGGGGDPFRQGQNLATPLGKILRIDPLGRNGTGGDHGIVADNVFASDANPNTLAENYAYGFRNPQRFSWDRGGANRMFIGDVGQGVVEEVDVGVNGGNFGWGEREGNFIYVNGNTVAYPANPDPTTTIKSIAEYDHGDGSAVSGGFVYRGSMIPELAGKYVFGDLGNGRVFYTDADAAPGSGQSGILELLLSESNAAGRSLLSLIRDAQPNAGRADLRLGQDATGNLYLLNKQDGVVRVLVPEPAALAALAAASAALLVRRRGAR